MGLAGGCLWLLGSLSGLPSLAWPALLVSPLPSAWPGVLLLLVSGVSWSCSSALSSARGLFSGLCVLFAPSRFCSCLCVWFSFDLSLNAWRLWFGDLIWFLFPPFSGDFCLKGSVNIFRCRQFALLCGFQSISFGTCQHFWRLLWRSFLAELEHFELPALPCPGWTLRVKVILHATFRPGVDKDVGLY